MRAPHDEGNGHIRQRAQAKFGSDSALHQGRLNTPTSVISLKVAPSDLTQAQSFIASLAEAFRKLGMLSPSMSNLFGDSSPDHLPPDLHGKLHNEASRRSMTDTVSSIIQAFSASKALNQVLGTKDPEPFVAPPAIPSNLREIFETGLQGNEQFHTVGRLVTGRGESFMASVSSQQGKTALADILEEKESSLRVDTACENTTGASSELKISVPKYTSGKQAVAVAQRYTLMNSDGDAAEDTTSQHVVFESDEDHGFWKHRSSTTLAASDYSQPGSAASGPSLPPPSFDPCTSSLLSLPSLDSSDSNAPSLPHSVTKRLFGSRATLNRHVAPATRQQSSKEAPSHLNDTASSLRESESLLVLFPSRGVLPAPKVPVHNKIARRYADKYIQSNGALDDDSLGLDQGATSSPPSHIKIHAPSPVKSKKSGKRAPSSTNQYEIGPPLAQPSRREDTTGLPVLPLEAEAEWTDDFPGNTYALLTILLTWSHTMWTSIYRQHDPRLFSIHPAFAYPITPPVRKQLVSVSFYDNSTKTHKEVRFLGPGDAAQISYHEVDVLADPNSKTSPPASPRCNSPVDAIRQSFRLVEKEASKNTRYTSMAHRAKTGQGRWCYVLIKGSTPSDGRTPPHVMLAWHVSAVTSTSDCLHTIYADDAASKPAVPVRKKVKRFSSFQNLTQTIRNPAKFNFHHSLRIASSSSELPSIDPYATSEQRKGVTLNRTVMNFEKAGEIPLIEGFRVDVKAFRDWMEACGRGKGKAILWSERNAA
ncbi:hypothetical protein E8E12_006549 [Didymella heteroderae]|uniref:Uncharacterized protein n=1 Tax=Didymella heteroderae TaxID=1769908 RepID=A0A9P5C140_9PLEO|nr:hypothetical protein E8E12_006549 [Didymella heteroderae]